MDNDRQRELLQQQVRQLQSQSQIRDTELDSALFGQVCPS